MILTHTLIAITAITVGGLTSLIAWTERKSKKLTFDITLTAMLFAIGVMVSYSNFPSNIHSSSQTLLDNFSSTLVILLSALILYSHKESINEKIKFGEYLLLFSLTVVSSVILILSNNLFTVFLAIELLSIALYILVGFDKKPTSIEASVKYLITGSFATLFFVFSFIFIKYSQTPPDLSSIPNAPSSIIVSVAGIFFLSGIFFKIALVPLHWWAVDVYCGSPTYITTALTSFIKFAVIIAGYKIYSSFAPHIPYQIMSIIIILTLLIPNISALTTKNIKKILVYSGISHAGFVAIGFLNPSNSYVYFYMFIYSITAMGAFTLLYLIEKVMNDLEYQKIEDLWNTHPILVIILSIFLFSLAGIPPFAGFFAKFYIFYSAINSSHTILAIIAAVSSAIAAYYYIKILIPIFKHTREKKTIDTSLIRENPYTFSVIIISACAVLLFGIFSSSIISFIEKIM